MDNNARHIQSKPTFTKHLGNVKTVKYNCVYILSRFTHDSCVVKGW